MKQLQLIDRVVVEIKSEEGEKCSPFDIAQELRKIADRIDDCIKGDNELRTNPNNGLHTEVLWERECIDFGFRMGNKSLISDAYYGAKEFFEVCSVSKEDIEEQGFDASKLTNEDMERIASKMNDLICEGCDYWNAVDGACEYWEVPRKENDDVREVIPGTLGMLNELSIRE